MLIDPFACPEEPEKLNRGDEPRVVGDHVGSSVRRQRRPINAVNWILALHEREKCRYGENATAGYIADALRDLHF